MNIKDCETKCLVYTKHLDQIYRRASKDRFFDGDVSAWKLLKDEFGSDVVRVCRNIEVARYKRAQRARSRVGQEIEQGNAYFVTLTFKDEVLDKTSEETRRRYVSRAFKAIGKNYLANIDYGSKTEREHYHGLVVVKEGCLASWKNGKRQYKDMPDFRDWTKNYGFVDIKRVKPNEKDMKKVTSYTAKLGAHAVKESTLKGVAPPRLIYSRNRLEL